MGTYARRPGGTMSMKVARRHLVAAGALALAVPARSAGAQPTWPAARPIRLVVGFPPGGSGDFLARTLAEPLDRKSTRLNSSHTVISYAVFCLKKKKKK